MTAAEKPLATYANTHTDTQTNPHPLKNTWYVAATPSAPPSAGNIPPYAAAAATASRRGSGPRRRDASADDSPISRRWRTRCSGDG